MKQTTPDLAHELFVRLRQRSDAHAQRFESLFMKQHPNWTTGNLPSLTQQIHIVNEFWRMQLGLMSIDTLSVRSCIADNVTVEDWLSNFERYLIDFILNQQAIPNYRWPALSA